MMNRSRTDTFAKILETVYDHGEDGDGVTQNTIRYEALLSGAQLKEYLMALTIHGLLGYHPTSRRYNITKKGLWFLQIYYNMSNILNQDNNNNNIPWSIEEEEEEEQQHLRAIKMANLGANNISNKDEHLDRLLVVDDDPDILQFFKLALLSEGRFIVDAFTNPEDALKSFKANAKAYRLMLSDIRMPSLSGIQLARKVKEINFNVKIVLITAFELEDTEFSEAFPSNKIDAFLQKPVDTGELTNKVLSLLKRPKSRQ
jgi:CheY-like chemotaxis protein/predicted transcriptional regulator